jgi:hypothetical protein
MSVKYAVLRHPAGPTAWDRETAERARARIARHTTGDDAADLLLLVLRAKVDGPATKLAALTGTPAATAASDLKSAYFRLRGEKEFNRLFHLIRAAL